MFFDNDITEKLQLQHNKVGYLLAYDIAPYFQAKLLDVVNKHKYFVVRFDKSLNKITQKQSSYLS